MLFAVAHLTPFEKARVTTATRLAGPCPSVVTRQTNMVYITCLVMWRSGVGIARELLVHDLAQPAETCGLKLVMI